MVNIESGKFHSLDISLIKPPNQGSVYYSQAMKNYILFFYKIPANLKNLIWQHCYSYLVLFQFAFNPKMLE